MKDKLLLIESLVAENNRLHKELQVLRTGDNVEAYTPYRDAGFAVDVLRKLGFGAKKPEATLAELMKEAALMLMDMQKYAESAEQTLQKVKKEQEAIFKVSFGHECDATIKKNPIVNQVAKLRGTLELIKVRLERMDKVHSNEDIEQLYFDLNKFLSMEAKV